jgi:hypothetical protein
MVPSRLPDPALKVMIHGQEAPGDGWKFDFYIRFRPAFDFSHCRLLEGCVIIPANLRFLE